MSSTPPSSRMSLLTEEEMEPYVRKKRRHGESLKTTNEGMNEQEQQLLRDSINSRERKRMHDLNDSLEDLRACLPHSKEPASRKLSKISTIMLAVNWIRLLTKENARLTAEVDSLRRQLASGSTTEPKETSVQPGTIVPFPLLPTVPLCVRPLGQPCFCMMCITSRELHSS